MKLKRPLHHYRCFGLFATNLLQIRARRDLVEHRVQRGRRGFLEARHDVGVEVKGHGDGRVAEALLNDLRMHARLEQQAGMAVPRVMQPEVPGMSVTLCTVVLAVTIYSSLLFQPFGGP